MKGLLTTIKPVESMRSNGALPSRNFFDSPVNEKKSIYLRDFLFKFHLLVKLAFVAQHKFNIVIAEDQDTVRQLLVRLAEKNGFNPMAAEDGETAMKLVSAETQVVLLDLKMPGWDGFRCLQYLAKEFPKIPAIILTSAYEHTDVVRAMKLGAIDYIVKPFDPEELFTKLRQAVRIHEVQEENDFLREEIGENREIGEVVAASEIMRDLLEKAKRVATLDSTVLLTGESGVGKGVFARTIHAHSKRAKAPFVTVSCPALPRELLESELFGHEKGAFTGAVKRRIGKIEAAKGGTLFLDEIGDLPIDLQPKLLNVIQDRVYQRVGGEQNLSADVRIVAATNINFEEKIRNGEFREDLYYRLSVIPLEVPSLRERPEDVPALIDHVLKIVARRRNLKPYKLDIEARGMLCSYPWPGNVRELENVMERVTAFAVDGVIRASDLPNTIRGEAAMEKRENMVLAGKSLDEIERMAIIQTLAMCNGNKADAARHLGIAEKSVYNKIRYHNIITQKA